MIPSNKSSYNSSRRRRQSQQPKDVEDLPQQYDQNRPQTQTQMQNYSPTYNLIERQYKQNRKHVQVHQSQPSSSPFHTFSIKNGSALRQRPVASTSTTGEFSSQSFSVEIGGSGSKSHAGPGNPARLAIRSNAPPRRGRRPKNPPDASSPRTQNSVMPKRRGRPPKAYTALAKNANPELMVARDQKSTHGSKPNSQPDDNPPKKRGRRPKQPTPEVEIQAPNPMYLIYKCEWKDCPAQLHNLATLRLHLFKNHKKRENETYSCFWKGCKAGTTAEGEDELASGPELNTQYKCKDEDEWTSHVEKKHLTPYAWHMGDGPQNSLNGPKKYDPSVLPAYLFDKNGVQVTPSVENQQIEDGDPRTNNAQRFRRRLNGLDYVLDPIYDPKFESSIHSGENKNKGVHSANEDEDDDDDVDMDIGPTL
ncbi:hypothetical protein DSL72_007172 [Monilinia vaccinii-corymbosi]|uniref:C2H2-type domain-containing protein n=1 Tax=Monilinia vaccinii-corymbosi TaxID=61207 RepID=A0A8A3PL40_9HELO|nr:hypothetical protein DSL72_007172 [Monilinia vaccinii-corymbosi]